jgi:YVTN family beta-propeller protein
MKRINNLAALVAVLLMVIASMPAHAAVPAALNYQGFLTNPTTGAPLTTAVGTPLSITFKLYNAVSGGTALYTEVQPVTVTNGVFNVQIGTVTPLSLPFDVPYWLEITIGAEKLAPRQPLSSSAYTQRSAVADALAQGAVSAASTRTPRELATLAWYDHSSTAIATFSVGTSPKAITFDGTHIWVANSGSGNVSELDPSSGATLNTVTVGTAPVALCFDGQNIWVANSGSNNVSRINATTLTVNTFNAGVAPSGLAFDGNRVWVTNYSSDSVAVLNVVDGSLAFSASTGSHPMGIAFDGTSMWVANTGTTLETSVTKITSATGAVVGTYSSAAICSVCGFPQPVIQSVAFDGTYVWVTSFTFGTIQLYDALTGATGPYYTLAERGIAGIAFDGKYMWVTQVDQRQALHPNMLSRINVETGVIRSFDFLVSTDAANGLAFDGKHMWFTNTAQNSVTRY